MIQNIETIVKEEKCCGCGACVNICPTQAIKYQKNQYGFIIPEVDSKKCVFCKKCTLVCPTLNSIKRKPQIAYAAKCLEDNICLNSSSGGIFGIIAELILNTGGIVYGCVMNQNFKVKHIRVTSKEQLMEVMRSKYVQSYMGDVYRQVEEDLKNNEIVLFSGTPCQVAALNNYVADSIKKNLFAIDVVCHGVPSQDFFDSYLDMLEQKYGEIEKYIFRYKRIVNNGMNWYSAYSLKKSHKIKVRNWPEDIYDFLYMKAYIYRNSCYKCEFATIERAGDMTLCDYWNWEKYHNEFELGNTVSGVLINNSKAEYMWKKISDKLKYVETDIDNIKNNNSCLVKPIAEPYNREALLKYWKEKGMLELNRVFKQKNGKQIRKYFILRNVPQCIVNVLLRIRLKLLEG
ncbi:MAG: Coenzyme F420 hydrogenase/dehydrogenase, beta subunit C-terminal domain [Intestinibacter sp.]